MERLKTPHYTVFIGNCSVAYAVYNDAKRPTCTLNIMLGRYALEWLSKGFREDCREIADILRGYFGASPELTIINNASTTGHADMYNRLELAAKYFAEQEKRCK